MAAKGASCLGAVLSTVFTTLIAPIVVSIVTAEVKPGEGKAPAPGGAAEGRPRVARDATAGSAQVIAQGAGWSPEEATQDALRNALRSAAAGRFDADTWARQGPALFSALLRDTRGLVVCYQGLRSGSAVQQGRQYYYTTLAVDVAQRPLAERLRAAALTSP
jgi:hypothetical protein